MNTKLMKRVFAILVVMMLVVGNIAFASPMVPDDIVDGVVLKVGNREYTLNSGNVNRIRGMSSDGGTSYSLGVTVDMGFNDEGELVPIPENTGIMPMGSISEGDTMVSAAFRWSGVINYDLKTFDNLKCYKPTSYSYKITTLDSQFVLTKLSLHGGAVGYCYDSNGVKQVGQKSTGDRSYSISSAVSGKNYSKSYGTSYYFIKEGGTSINSYGTFKYKRKLATGEYSSEYTSSEFAIDLI